MTLYKHGQSNTSKTARVVKSGDSYEVSVDDALYHISMVNHDAGVLYFTLDGRRHRIPVAEEGGQYYVAVNGQEYCLEKADARRRVGSEASQTSTVIASMPGTIRAVYVLEGEAVEKGSPVILMEAMKMEIRLVAPRDGTVKTVRVTVGQLVKQNDVLVELT